MFIYRGSLMLFSVVRKSVALLLFFSALNVSADEQASITVKLPLGAAFISNVSYASANIADSEYKTLAVGKSATQSLNTGDLVLVDTWQTLDAHQCDYFQVIGTGDASISYTGAAWKPKHEIDSDETVKLVFQSRTNLFHSCDNPALVKDTFLNN
ncbi:hypothetical protein ElyMa_006572800 [Elysia marginata]|uniref:Reelin domain-containing protein n=1 Tax=Elysia marginata TaxID=1093978 RepID=A0AAV4IDG9_9GAST|nr:hypothetical protein ElyMa_006572800 [Elysia marginata]